MNLLNRSILILITISVFAFLFFVTFVTNSFSKFDKPYYENTIQGLFKLENSESTFFISNETVLNNSETDPGTIFVEKINLSDKVLFSYGEIKKEKKDNDIFINITPGIYFFQLKEINSNYIISGNGFTINNKGPGSFIVNNINSRKVMIFSIDTLLSLNLKDLKTDEEITQIGLYPHKYLVFNPIKNIFVKNSDLLKVSQIFTLGFFNEKIHASENFLNLILLKNEKGTDFIKNSFSFFNNEKNEKNNFIKDFKNSTFGSIPGEKIIAEYTNIFINPNKKSLYYKNIIIRKINDLLNSENIDIITINEINDYLIILNEFDEEGTNEIRKIIEFHYVNIITSNSISNLKINFTKLIDKINNENNKTKIDSLIYLEEVFANYNSDDFYKNINIFTEKYFKDLNISIDGSDKKKGSIDEVKEIDYLLYFIENIMLNSKLESIANTGDIINIFDNYMNISNSFYSYSNDNIKRTGLYTNLDILNKFVKIINQYYFTNEENSILLEINHSISINKKDISILEKNINKIFLLFENNKSILDIEKSTKDKVLIQKLYPDLKLKYEEYFYALNDFEEYLTIYDNTKKDILKTNTINESTGESKVKLSVKNAEEYINSFNGIQLTSSKITIMDYIYCNTPTDENINIELINPFCYKIDNIIIDKQKVSFILYPFLGNKIDNITILKRDELGILKLEIKPGSYKLDDIKLELDETIKTIKKNRELYEFSNFLVNTFGRETYIPDENIQETIKESVILDDPFIRIFKRNKLLSDIGDFADLSGTINILYDNIFIEKKGDIYDIYIDSADFELTLSKKEDYKGFFSSKYDFSEKHSFINPKIKTINKKTKKDLLLGNYIYITGEYGVNNIKEEIKDLFNFYEMIDYFVANIYQNLNNKDVEISYNKESKKITFKTTYKLSNVIIELYNGKITNATFNGKKIIEEEANYKLLNSILKKITN